MPSGLKLSRRIAAAQEQARRYRHALAVFRSSRTGHCGEPGDALAEARRLGVAPTQADDEVLRLLDLLRQDPPRTVVEIGTDEGGTLFLWTRIAHPRALLVGVDVHPLGRLGRQSAWALTRRAFARERQHVELLMPADSHAPATVERLRELLGGRPVDFLFIDGDHTYEGVRRDFELYSPLVRAGGVIALHDVATPRAAGVVRFWKELEQTLETMTLVSTVEPAYGIGVYRVATEGTGP